MSAWAPTLLEVPGALSDQPTKTRAWSGVVLRNRGNHITVARVDWVQVPADLPLGEYVISFRWDTMDMQVWVSCANLRIVA